MNERLLLWRVRARRAAPSVAVGLVFFVLGAVIFSGGSGNEDRRAAAPGHEHEGQAGDGEQPTIWTCSMHPQIRQDQPGKCPICGMDLIPVSSSAAAASAPNRVVWSERAQALAHLRTTEVRRQGGAGVELRLLGRVEPDETSLRTVTAWIAGRIDRLQVRVTGQKVGAGQVVATLYSPEIFTAHQDLISTKRQLDRMSNASGTARSAAASTLDAARERLRLLGVPDGEVERMETQDRPTKQVPIRTPFGGTVIERVATEGAYVTTGAPLYRIADLSRLWVQLDAYETDLPALAVGQAVRIEVESLPGESVEGRVAFIDPTIDPRRRTARVRVQVSNRDGRLRPGMFAQAIVAGQSTTGAAAPLVVPDSAPLFTGRRSLVYVEVPEQDKPTYEAREVRLGPRAGNVYPVVAGLSEGERVVTRGAFAIDADLQIRGGESMMAGGDDSEEGRFDEIVHVSAELRRRVAPVVSGTLAIAAALAADDLGTAQTAATSLARDAAHVAFEQGSEAQHGWSELQGELRQHAEHVAKARTLEDARSGFEALSGATESVLRRFGNPLDSPVRLAYCPMAFGSRGASWLQPAEAVENAYFGQAMHDCGEIRQTVRPGDYLPAPAAAPATPAAPHSGGGHQH